MSKRPALRCRGVGVVLGGTDIIEGVDLCVEAGEWLSIIGPNGAGKSTLLRAIAGGVSSTGTIELFGTLASEMDRKALAQTVAWVAQHPLLPGGMRTFDYVLLGRTPYHSALGANSSEDLDIARTVLDQLDLDDLADRYVDTLSGGERQRVLIARALVQRTPLVLLDEPTTALDLGHQQEVLDLLDQLRTDHDLTIVSTMHDLSLAGQYAGSLALLSGGSLRRHGKAADVLTADVLETHFGAQVSVIVDDDGTVIVVPKRAHRAKENL